MPTIEKFEDIQAWQKARNLSQLVYQLTQSDTWDREWDLKRQLRRTAISVMANIAEGFGRKSHREFANFLNIAHGSAAELQSHLYIALDEGYVAQNEFRECYAMCEECSRMLQAFQDYLVGLSNSGSSSEPTTLELQDS